MKHNQPCACIAERVLTDLSHRANLAEEAAAAGAQQAKDSSLHHEREVSSLLRTLDACQHKLQAAGTQHHDADTFAPMSCDYPYLTADLAKGQSPTRLVNGCLQNRALHSGSLSTVWPSSKWSRVWQN